MASAMRRYMLIERSNAMPQSVPVTMRVMNWGGMRRLGVSGAIVHRPADGHEVEEPE